MALLRLSAAIGASLSVAVLAASGCTFDGPRDAPGSRLVRVKERDFHLSAPSRLAPGNTTFSVRNRGPIEHEFIVVRKRPGRPLPIRADGLTIDEERIAPGKVGALEPDEPGIRTLDLHLAPGNYEMFCNMSGHFMAGMHRKFVVQ